MFLHTYPLFLVNILSGNFHVQMFLNCRGYTALEKTIVEVIFCVATGTSCLKVISMGTSITDGVYFNALYWFFCNKINHVIKFASIKDGYNTICLTWKFPQVVLENFHKNYGHFHKSIMEISANNTWKIPPATVLFTSY